MKQFSLKAILSLFILTGLISCSKEPKQTKYIPKDAPLVFSINPSSLALKADLAALKDYDFMKDLGHKKDSSFREMQTLFSNPFSLGIDLFSDIYVWINMKDTKNANGYFVVSLTDAEEFETVLLKAMKDSKKEQFSNFSFAQKNNMIVSWNNNVAIIAIKNNQQTIDEAKIGLEEIYNLTAEGSISTLAEFKTFEENESDLNIFIAQDAYFKSIANSNPFAPVGIYDEMNGLYSYGTITFNDNSIDMQAGSIKNEAYKKYKSKYGEYMLKYNEGLNKIMPNKHLGLFSFAFNTSLLADSLGSFPIPNKAMVMQGAPILKGFGGSFCFNFTDVKSVFEQKMIATDTGFVSVPKEKMVPQFSVGFDVNDYNALQSLLMMAQQAPMVQMENDYFVVDLTRELGTNIYFSVTKEFGLISTDQVAVQNLSIGNTIENNLAGSDAGNLIATHGNYFHINLNIKEYPSAIQQALKDKARTVNDLKVQETVFGMLKDMEMKTINNEDVSCSINFQEKDGNILQNFIEMGNALYLIKKEEKKITGPDVEMVP